MPNLKRNLILMFLVLCIVVPLAAQAYALYFAPQPVIEPPPPMPPTAAFTISPSHTCQIDWIEQWNGESMERIYQYPTLTFYGTHSRDPEGQMVSYTWNFGDGAFGSEPILTHTYAAAGTYTVSLTVVDSQGLTSSTTKTVTVLPAPKTTVYIAPSTLTGLAIGDSFTVTVMVSDVSDLYLWNIGVVFNPEVIECLSVEKAGNFASKRSVLDGADVGYIVEENLFPGTAGETVWVTPKINNAAGVIGPGPACGLIGDVPGVSGSGAVATITFRVLSSGSSFIQLTDVHLANSIMQEIAVNVGNGYFVLP